MQKVKLGKRKEKSEMKKRNKMPRVAITVLACLILAGVSITVYSKYYKTGYNKGMAIASGFYFGSNYMAELDLEDETAKQIHTVEDLVKSDLISQLPTRASNSGWNNNGSSFESSFLIDIDNYANQLLYNDKDLNISYTVEFILLDVPKGVSYQVCKGNNTGNYVPINEKKKVVFTGELEGGKLSWDTYQFHVSISDLNNYETARVLALAYPTDPTYVQGTKKIAGIITADYREVEMDITNQGFTIENSLTNSNWKDIVKKEAAFEYQVRTTGNYSADAATGQMQKIKVSWKPNLYVLDKYDKYKVELEKQYESNPAELSNYLNEAEGWMILETIPYSSIKFTFFKKEGFDTELDNISSSDEFKASIHAEKIS